MTKVLTVQSQGLYFIVLCPGVCLIIHFRQTFPAIPYPNPKHDNKINKGSFYAMISCLAC